MVVNTFVGRGRRARAPKEPKRGGWLFRLFMAWFMRGR